MIGRLSVRRFRNLRQLEADFEAGATLLVGATGAGKTSLLEAIYLLATTKSFRTPRLNDCLGSGGTGDADDPGSGAGFAANDGFALGGEVDGGRRSRLDLGWSAADGLWRKVNGEAASAVDYLQVLPAVAWSSAEGETLVGPPALRRRMLDRGVVAIRPASIELLSQYRRALEHKRKLLLSPSRDQSLSAWNELLATSGADLARRRQQYVERLAVALGETWRRADLGWPPVHLVYRPSAGEAAVEAAALFTRLEAETNRERECGRPLVGPHLDRLDVLWRNQPVRQRASAGERKAIGLLLLAAHAAVLRAADREPILLLDDLDTELDRQSLQAVSRAFTDAGQRVISSNRPAVFEGVSVDRRWEIRSGQIVSL